MLRLAYIDGPAIVASCLAVLLATAVTCATTMPHADGYVGNLQQFEVREQDSLIELARHYDIGYNSIVAANPGIDPFLPKPGTIISVPTAWILPPTPVRPAIVINLPEYRLYYFSTGTAPEVTTFPIGIGDQGDETPTGNYRVIEKIYRPSWKVPESIRARNGKLPKVLHPGPDNPMGSHALRLSRNGILIHGTNRPWGIGRRSSHGCLRLYPEDIVQLYKLVERGTAVTIINQPIKIGLKGEKIYIEVHGEGGNGATVGQALHLLARKNLVARINFRTLITAVEDKKGIPVDITLQR